MTQQCETTHVVVIQAAFSVVVGWSQVVRVIGCTLLCAQVQLAKTFNNTSKILV